MKHKEKTKHGYFERINRVLIYIDNHLDERITLSDLAEISNFSHFHFHRIFSSYVGESLSSYIRRLKIQRASGQLVYTNEPITQIALNSGFENISSFSKAFKQITGYSPCALRKTGYLVGYKNPFFKNVDTLGKNSMNLIIKSIKPQTVIFVRRQGDPFKVVSQAWISLKEYFFKKNISEENIKLLGISHDDPAVTREEFLRYDACLSGINNPMPEGEIGVQTIEGGKYAVFEHIGPYETLSDMIRKIFREWYPKSNRQLRNIPLFIHYVNLNLKSNYSKMNEKEIATLISHIYVPIE